MTPAQQADALYYNHLWQKLFAEQKIPQQVPPDAAMFRRDLGRSLRVMFNWLGNLHGQRVLELGCGPGDYTVMLARRGARVTALDIAPASVQLTHRRAATKRLTGSVLVQRAAAESLPFANGGFDWVVGFGLLHHADPIALAPEVRRVLKPGGRALFREPLGANPLLGLVRQYIPYRQKYRSPNESPLIYAGINRIGRHFSRTRIREFYLFSMISRAVGSETAFPGLWALDEYLLGVAPFLRRWCRYVLLEYAT